MSGRETLMPLDDLSAADWLVEALTEFHGRVMDLATESFASYARIFHRPDQGLESDEVPSSWASIADERGTVFHPAAQFHYVAHPLAGVGHEATAGPRLGSLEHVTLPRLHKHVAAHTTTQQKCRFALWEGFGSAPDRWRGSPTFRLPGRAYWLFAGALAELVELSVQFESSGLDVRLRQLSRQAGVVQSPTIWWPEDRAWVVHSEIDYDSTIVGGPTTLIEAIVEDPAIEALHIEPDVSLYANGDTINGPYRPGHPGLG